MAELRRLGASLGKHDPGCAARAASSSVDATTGSNALAQAREFHAAVDLTGLIVTKLDGSGKGGVVIAIQHELGIPTHGLLAPVRSWKISRLSIAAYSSSRCFNVPPFARAQTGLQRENDRSPGVSSNERDREVSGL